MKETSRVDKAFQRASVWCEGVRTVGVNAFRSCFLKTYVNMEDGSSRYRVQRVMARFELRGASRAGFRGGTAIMY